MANEEQGRANEEQEPANESPQPDAVVIERLVHRYQPDGPPAVNDVSLSVREGAFYTLLGPSGCGKTTLLRCIAGLERPAEGQITLDGEVVVSSRRFVPPERRPLGMVFQDYAIWPHLTVFENVAFPLRVQRNKISAADLREAVLEVLRLVGLEHLSERKASQLSGGQQQRTALARALVRRPKVLLLDEPLSNLDAQLREQTRVELRLIQRRLRVTTIFVTHDQVEALAMSNVIAVLRDGQVEQVGSPRDIYERPRTEYVAAFIGSANILHGTALGTTGKGGGLTVRTPIGDVHSETSTEVKEGEAVVLTVRPESLRLHSEKPAAAQAYEGRVVVGLFVGDAINYTVEIAGIEVRVKEPSTVRVRTGATVFVEFPAASCTLIPRDTIEGEEADQAKSAEAPMAREQTLFAP
jgi:iron(III) transport system ATP-binding protein